MFGKKRASAPSDRQVTNGAIQEEDDMEEDADIRISIVKKAEVGQFPHQFIEVSQHLTLAPTIAGSLMKLSTKGKWQRRWWEIKGPFLMYWQSNNASLKKKNILPLPDAAIDLRVVAKVSFDEKTSILALVSQRGRVFNFKPTSGKDFAMMQQWKEAVMAFMVDPPADRQPSVEAIGVVCAESTVSEADRATIFDDAFQSKESGLKKAPGPRGARPNLPPRAHQAPPVAPVAPPFEPSQTPGKGGGGGGCCFAACTRQN